MRQNIGRCQQTFCFQKSVDNAQQCFAFTPQANFSIIWIFTEGDGIESSLPFRIFSTITNVLLGPLFIRRDFDSIPRLIRFCLSLYRILLSIFEFERQNIAGCCLQTLCVQFSSILTEFFCFLSGLLNGRKNSNLFIAAAQTELRGHYL